MLKNSNTSESTYTKDLRIARHRLNEMSLALSVVKDGNIVLEAREHGISSILATIDTSCGKFHEASVADRVVGKAIAMLYVHAGVKATYATTLSKMAKQVLEEAAIFVEWTNLTENILNLERTDLCPFEKAVVRIRNPKTAYKRLKALQDCVSKGK
jgi:hypothetical protein